MDVRQLKNLKETEMSSIAIFGAGGHAGVVGEIAEKVYEKLFFFDDHKKTPVGTIWPISGDFNDLINQISRFDAVFVAIGDNGFREEKYLELRERKVKFATLFHPSAVVSKYSAIGEGSLVAAGAVINPFCVIGEGAIINTASTIDHDCILKDFVHVSPGAHVAGNVEIGSRTWVGIGASINQNLKVGKDALIAAGAVVVNNVSESIKVAGVPARRM